ncbi:MAG TPA: type I restriction endonuclease subunit R [candidate division Zixibacteria bacterium]|nr:type I restriction endonuclease subunit R [candidate division Zixibacteria bacterium]
MTNPDAEATLENATLVLFKELGWETLDCFHEATGDMAGLSEDQLFLGRETRSEVILKPRLLAALERLNPQLPEVALELAMTELTHGRGTMSLARANSEIYDQLKNGIPVTYRDDQGDQQVERARIIDWTDPVNNDYLACQQFWVTGEVYTRRPDVIGFVNGLPLLLIELKKHSKPVKDAFDGNLSDYKDTIPQLFWYNGLIILSNASDSRLGAVNTPWSHFAQWKKINSEGEAGVIALETMIRATCEPGRLLDVIENFTLFEEGRGGVNKILAKNHQFLGVNNAITAVHDIRHNQGRLGVFWHTQGSGKSFSMIFFAQKVMRRLTGNWTFVIITDRRDLDDQIYKTFANCGVITEPENSVRAQSGDHLQQLLQEDHRYIFTLIHKFHIERGQTYPILSERDDIIVITDEAHRSQYDILAQNMRNALPNAAFIGFTGTPLMAGEERTREVFGDYVSIYNFKESIDDGATVPLYYENRIPELQLTNEQLNEQMERLLEDAELDEAQEEKLEREFSREYHLITRDDRLEKIAEDIVQHSLSRGYRGKAMIVCIDKLTAVRMYNKVRDHWNRQLAIDAADLESAAVLESAADEFRLAELREQVDYLKGTDMAVIISEGQNEIAEFKAKGFDILPHRKRMKSENLDEKFKDPQNPLRLVFVCAMWMTGFDVPSCSTIYLDKPMRNHTLMQTIARANRVFGQKNNGLIVDYIGVFRNLQKALAIYGSSPQGDIDEGERPIKSKDALFDDLKEAIEEASDFCASLAINVQHIAHTDGFERINLMDDALNGILVNDDCKRLYLNLAGRVDRLFKAILPDERANAYIAIQAVFKTLIDKIRASEPEADITQVMDQVEDLLDRSIGSYVIREKSPPFDLSVIDFEALKKVFRTGRKNIEANKLRGAINSQIVKMVRLNESRIDYLEKFQQMIDDYNAGRDNVDIFFEKLLGLAQQLNEEEQRGIRENLSEEELALFDLLLKPRPELTKAEIARVKEAARDLLDTLKAEQLVLDWRKQQRTRAAVRITIEQVLDKELPAAYETNLYRQKCELIYNHVYEKYYGNGRSIYSLALAA